MKTFAVLHDDKVDIHSRSGHDRGFTQEELEKWMNNHSGIKEKKIICIEDEIEKYKIAEYKGILLDSEEEMNYVRWKNAVDYRRISRSFSLPINVMSNEEYEIKLKEKLDEFVSDLERPAFIYEKDLCKKVKENCKTVLDIFYQLRNGENEIAETMLSMMLNSFLKDPFLVSELNGSYSFRYLAPFLWLRSEIGTDDYEKVMKTKLTFYRVRTKDNEDEKTIIETKEDILHLPFKMRDRAGDMRFSRKGMPCLYLGTTTYICSKECMWDSAKEKMYASVFVPNDYGEKLKVLNLTISPALINGLHYKILGEEGTKIRKLQNSMLQIFPLIIATSFSIEHSSNEKDKYEYYISQALMRVINRCKIDGIAYLSMKGENEFQYPQGVNLALPACDISEKKQYSKICEGFNISNPILFDKQEKYTKSSFINKTFNKVRHNKEKKFLGKDSEWYGDTEFGKFDNYLYSKLVDEDFS